MQIFDTLRKTEYKRVVALGFFDGVHKGHREVLMRAIESSSDECKSAVFTFKSSPHNIMNSEKKQMLTTNEQKFGLFEECGIDEVYCVDFESVMSLTAEEFVSNILKDMLNAKTVVTGYNYHFGKGGTASTDDLKKLCNYYGIEVITCEPVMYKGEAVSSTRIRQCIANGETEDANAMLSYNFCVDTVVASGNHIGTKIESPTINQKLTDGVIAPRFGVYATKVSVDGNVYVGATNIGTHPTVGECVPVCETHLLDTEIDLYGKKVYTELVKFIREEQKFDSIDELKNQIAKDIDEIRSYFKK